MQAIIKNATSYKDNIIYKNKYDNVENLNCAQLIADLPFDNQSVYIKNISFFKAIIAILHYRISSYKDFTYEKSFYTKYLKDTLESLKKNPLKLSDFHKQQLFYEIVELLKYFKNSEHLKTSQDRQRSLGETLNIFIVGLGLEEQFKDYNFFPYILISSSHPQFKNKTDPALIQSLSGRAAMVQSISSNSSTITSSSSNNSTEGLYFGY